MSGTFETGLPAGEYADIISGKVHTVDIRGRITIDLGNTDDANVFAIHV